MPISTKGSFNVSFSVIDYIRKFLKDDFTRRQYFFKLIFKSHILDYLSDRAFLCFKYKFLFKRRLNLENPRRFTEKIQWLKLYDRSPSYTKMVDKYEVKKFISEKVGDQFNIPNFGVWDSFDEVDFDSLPQKFVLKTTHDSGGVLICSDKSSFDFKTAKEFFSKRLRSNFFFANREWPYKNVKPRIIAEQYIECESNDLMDYKIYCFNGKPKYLLVAFDRWTPHGPSFEYFDIDFNRLPFSTDGKASSKVISSPKFLSDMLTISEKLSEGIPHLRVDFYENNDSLYVGELTFYDNAGFSLYNPDEWDFIIGDYLDIPQVIS